MPEDGFFIDYSESVRLGKFLQLWSENLNDFDKGMEGMYAALGNEIGDMVISEIPNRIGGSYGQFMAARTDYEVIATPAGFNVSIYGLMESQVEGGKVGAGGQDYNLWSFYEFGGEVPNRGRTTTGGISIRKDVASVAVVRSTASGFSVQGKAGAIQTLVAGLNPRINEMIAAALRMYSSGKIAKAHDDAMRDAQIQGSRLSDRISSYVETLALPPEIVDVVLTSINKQGGAVLQARNTKGQFGKKVGVVF